MTESNSITAATYPIAVVMERAKLASPWQPYRWEAKGVVRDIFPAGTGERVMLKDEQLWQILYPGFALKLMLDEAEGYWRLQSQRNNRQHISRAAQRPGITRAFISVAPLYACDAGGLRYLTKINFHRDRR